jgi:hypothetical protein
MSERFEQGRFDRPRPERREGGGGGAFHGRDEARRFAHAFEDEDEPFQGEATWIEGKTAGDWGEDEPDSFTRHRRASARRRHAGVGYAGLREGEPGYGGDDAFRQAGVGYAGRGPKGYQRSDERIREDVCEGLTAHPDVDASGIEVTVQAREVVLEGVVPDRASKRCAEDCAYEVRGVEEVHNRLRVAPGGSFAGSDRGHED